jgi:hypothetical protein
LISEAPWHTQQHQENGDSVAGVGADTGYDLGSTKPNYTTKEMAIGGMDTVPMSDAGAGVRPDLTPTELKAGGGKVDKRRMYNVIKVKGAPAERERQGRQYQRGCQQGRPPHL